jgi:TPP-dependent pyruvate/acetoin dehydrogenase alpha subunit
MGMALERAETETSIVHKAESYKMAAEKVDGMDVVAVESAARRGIDAIRSNRAPYFLECLTYRLRAHSMFDAQLYRPKEEVEEWRKKGPIVRFQKWLEANLLIRPEEVSEIEAEIDADIAAAAAFAEAGSLEPVSEVERFVTMAEVPG